MTIQNLFVADLSDIIGVHLECGACGAHVAYRPEGLTDVPKSCPQCLAEWTNSEYFNREVSDAKAFLEALKDLHRKTDKPRRVSVKLAYDLGTK